MSTALENPFRTSRLLSLPVHWAGIRPETLLARWEAAGRRGALVGTHGTGKTTRLRALAYRLVAEGWTVIWVQWHDDGTTTPDDWRATVRDAGPHTVLCLDGSENLGPISAYRLHRYTRSAGGVLTTRHRRSLLLPTLATYEPDAALFTAHAAILDQDAREAAMAAFAATGQNAHEAFRKLYFDYSRFSSRPIRAASASDGGLAA
ncbi:hypothetical protein IMCC26134_11210 [Verrucomicrobia bacterium IMCC26134]|jgi:hypothetical protein|nr:hypothetical protein IMCC26134_11210 [Verrucomicrobia bacterium IMCC26134]